MVISRDAKYDEKEEWDWKVDVVRNMTFYQFLMKRRRDMKIIKN